MFKLTWVLVAMALLLCSAAGRALESENVSSTSSENSKDVGSSEEANNASKESGAVETTAANIDANANISVNISENNHTISVSIGAVENANQSVVTNKTLEEINCTSVLADYVRARLDLEMTDATPSLSAEIAEGLSRNVQCFKSLFDEQLMRNRSATPSAATPLPPSPSTKKPRRQYPQRIGLIFYSLSENNTATQFMHQEVDFTISTANNVTSNSSTNSTTAAAKAAVVPLDPATQKQLDAYQNDIAVLKGLLDTVKMRMKQITKSLKPLVNASTKAAEEEKKILAKANKKAAKLAQEENLKAAKLALEEQQKQEEISIETQKVAEKPAPSKRDTAKKSKSSSQKPEKTTKESKSSTSGKAEGKQNKKDKGNKKTKEQNKKVKK